MAFSLHRLGYKKLSQITFNWQAADRASLLALFITIEVALHWLWCLLIWIQRDTLNSYVDMSLLYPLWLMITVAGLFFWWLIGHLSRIKNNKVLYRWQIMLIVPYTFYIAIVIVMMGYSSLFAGVSLVGGAMLGMMLIQRVYVWRMFLLQITLVVLAIVSPYLGIALPNLRHLTVTYPMLEAYKYLTYNEIMAIENLIAASSFKNEILGWERINDVQRSGAFFWRATHVYLALPKAVFIVYVFRTLLLILDDSKSEILQHANQDELTTLNNRRYGLTQMQQSLIATADTQDYSVILLDLDLFKNVNDSYGHEVGDQVLREVAQVLKDTLDLNSVSRYGGEEFLIVLSDTNYDSAMLVAEKLRDNISRHTIEVGHQLAFQVTASLGLYTLTHAEMRRLKQ